MVYFPSSAARRRVSLAQCVRLLLLILDVEDPGARLGKLVLPRDDVEVRLGDFCRVDGIVERVLADRLRRAISKTVAACRACPARSSGSPAPYRPARARPPKLSLLGWAGAPSSIACVRLPPATAAARRWPLDRVVNLHERRPLGDLLPLGDQNAHDGTGHFGVDVRVLAVRLGALDDPVGEDALRVRIGRRGEDGRLRPVRHGVDVGAQERPQHANDDDDENESCYASAPPFPSSSRPSSMCRMRSANS
jgi:hypothetical protein